MTLNVKYFIYFGIFRRKSDESRKTVHIAGVNSRVHQNLCFSLILNVFCFQVKAWDESIHAKSFAISRSMKSKLIADKNRKINYYIIQISLCSEKFECEQCIQCQIWSDKLTQSATIRKFCRHLVQYRALKGIKLCYSNTFIS